jgi:hypothetical protein
MPLSLPQAPEAVQATSLNTPAATTNWIFRCGHRLISEPTTRAGTPDSVFGYDFDDAFETLETTEDTPDLCPACWRTEMKMQQSSTEVVESLEMKRNQSREGRDASEHVHLDNTAGEETGDRMEEVIASILAREDDATDLISTFEKLLFERTEKVNFLCWRTDLTIQGIMASQAVDVDSLEAAKRTLGELLSVQTELGLVQEHWMGHTKVRMIEDEKRFSSAWKSLLKVLRK